MKRTSTIVAASVALSILLSGSFAFAQNEGAPKAAPEAQPQLQPVPQRVQPPQPGIGQPQSQPIPRQQPAAAPKPVPVQPGAAQPAPGQPVPGQPVTVIAPELLIGQWDINVDSYLDMRLQRKGRYEDPAKVAYARNLLKANGLNVRLDFHADGRMGVAKTYCGECEAKTGSWCVTCIEGQDVTVEVRSKHGWSRKDLDLVVLDDLHIQVFHPDEIAGIYERVPDSVTPAQPQAPGSAPTQSTERIPPEPAPAAAYEERPVLGPSTTDPVVPTQDSPGVTDEVAP